MSARGIRLAEYTASRANNFDLLRLGAAMLVLFDHCYPLTGRPGPDFGPLWPAITGQGVPVFFAISGFLITSSWLAAPSAATYAGKRALRLIPALVIAVALTSFVVGPLFTTLPLSDYLTDPTPYVYVLRCAVLFTFAGTLPGVFADNPFPAAVNGSLWTLPVEASAYVMIAILGGFGLLLRRWILPLGLIAALLLTSPLIDLGAAASGTNGGNAVLVVHLFALFLAGSLLFVHRDRVTLSWPLAAVLAVAWVVAANSGWRDVVGAVVLPYLVLMGAYRTPSAWRALTRPGDVSYGVYIYAFPVQQSVAALWTGVRPLQMFAIAAPISYALGIVSWRLIERRALRLKGRLPGSAVGGRPAVRAAASEAPR